MGADGYLDHSSPLRSRQGIAGLKTKFPRARVIGPAKEAAKIGPLDIAVGEDDHVKTGMLEAKVIEVPDTHRPCRLLVYTRRHSFCRDTLFAMGCGRGFEEPLPCFIIR